MAVSADDATIRNVGLVADPLIGQVLESYRIESLIGNGAMGMVYRGVHQVIGKAAAIKVLRVDYADDPEMVKRLIREARTVNSIRHPAIVDIFGFGTVPRTEQPYIVMDLIEGIPLDRYLQLHAPMPWAEATAFLDELLSALRAAHSVGVIHRDLKPSNIFVETRGDGLKGIKVIDFGLAKQADRAGGSIRPTNPGTLLGTPAFMAPEQIVGTKVTPSTDLYAVGGIAYQMLTNRLPHEAPTAIEVLSDKMVKDPLPPRHWSPRLESAADRWVMRLLAREPEQRFVDAEQARRELRHIPGSIPAPTGPLPKPQARKEASVSVQDPSSVITQEEEVAPKIVKKQQLPKSNPALDAIMRTDEVDSSPSRTPLLIAILSVVIAVLGILIWLVGEN